MEPSPEIRDFLSRHRLAVVGVSRDPRQTANAIFRRLRAAGYQVFPVNAATETVEGVACYPRLDAVPNGVEAVLAVTPPSGSVDVVRQAAELGIDLVWLHRGVGNGSASTEAERLGAARGVTVIGGGCPMMFVPPVDLFHRCLCWLQGRRGLLPNAARMAGR